MSNPRNPEEELVLKLALCGLSPCRVLSSLERNRPVVKELGESEAVRGGKPGMALAAMSAATTARVR